MYLSTKTYDHNIGLSCAFRQWRAESHCSKIHGYALAIKFTFATLQLNKNRWVVDFGAMKDLKEWLQEMFDHKLLVAFDDPKIHLYRQLHAGGVADVVVVNSTGCEMFAELIFDHTVVWLTETNPHARLVSVEVREHAGNSAIKLAEGASLPL